MTIPATGTITLRGTAARRGIQVEFGAAATNIRLGVYYRGGANVPSGAKATIATAGVQKFSNYRGATKVVGIVTIAPGTFTWHFDTTYVAGRYQNSLRFSPTRPVGPWGTPFPSIAGPTHNSVVGQFSAGFITGGGNALHVVSTSMTGLRYTARMQLGELTPFVNGDKMKIELVRGTNPNGPAATGGTFTFDLFLAGQPMIKNALYIGIPRHWVDGPNLETQRFIAWARQHVIRHAPLTNQWQDAGTVRTDMAGGTHRNTGPGFIRYTYMAA
jgi:hypothetical protein